MASPSLMASPAPDDYFFEPSDDDDDDARAAMASPLPMSTPIATPSVTGGAAEIIPATPEDGIAPTPPPNHPAPPPKRARVAPLKPLHDPNAPGALVMCTTEEATAMNAGPGIAVVVDPFVAKKLRPHQREGVRWMWRVVHGFEPVGDGRRRDADPHLGCLLADDMGLGKSLQSLALIYTMLHQGPRGTPTAKRALLVCPASLVGAWGAECAKWLGGVRAQTALAEGGGTDAADAYEKWARGPPPGGKSAFDRWPILVTSYETLRRFAPVAAAAKPDLMICDEAHRLRNAQQGSQTLAALRTVDAPRRVLLTGTPVQNDLDEYAAVMDFACPGLLGHMSDFHRKFTAVVRRGGEPDASASEIERAKVAAKELNALTSMRVLRREASVNAAHLPAKTEMIVFCSLTPTQRGLYEEGAKVVGEWVGGEGTASALCAIGLLRQLANSVDQALVSTYGKAKDAERAKEEEDAENDADEDGLSDGDGEDGRDEPRKDAADAAAETDLRARLQKNVPPEYEGGIDGSGKLATLRALLRELTKMDGSRDGGERVVVVSGFSAALDAAAVVCRDLGLPADRLDGRVPPNARSGLVRDFNRGSGGRVMLLSCVAGGAGLNLVGASRLILFDTSWNPAHDRQAMARVWRDGQTRPVTIYRLLAAGTVEEKVFQRQLMKHKEATVAGVGGEGIGAGAGNSSGGKFTRDELRGLIAFSDASRPATLDAAGWEDGRADVNDPLLLAAMKEEGSVITAVVKLAGDGGRAKAVEEAKKAAAARPNAARIGGKRLAFSDFLSKEKNRTAAK